MHVRVLPGIVRYCRGATVTSFSSNSHVSDRWQPFHTTTSRLAAERLENERIPFKTAILVKHPLLRYISFPESKPATITSDIEPDFEQELLDTDEGSERHVRRAKVHGHTVRDPEPVSHFFRPTPEDIDLGRLIDVETFLACELDRTLHKLELARIAPAPVVVLVPASPPSHHRHLANLDIPFAAAWLDSPDPGARLREIDVRQFLKTLDITKFKLELVSEHPKPIVRVVSREVQRKARQAAKEHMRQTRHHGEIKRFMFTWFIQAHDIEHKLNIVRRALDKGQKCDLVFGQKGHDHPGDEALHLSLAEKRLKLQEIVELMGSDARPYHETEIIEGDDIGIIYLEGLGIDHGEEPNVD